MSRAALWLTLLGMGVITFLLRASVIVLKDRLVFPGWLERALPFVPATVLSALFVPALFYRGGELALSLSNERLLAGGVAAIIAWRTNSFLATLCAGMLVLWGILLLR